MIIAEWSKTGRPPLPPPSRPISGFAVTILALNGSRPASLLPQFQMTAFTLAVQGIFQIRAPGLGAESVAGLAFFTGCPCFQTLRLPW